MTKLDLSKQTISLSWDDLTQRVELFLDAWDKLDSPPNMAEFLPAEPMALRRMVLTELAKIDLEQRTTRGLAARVDQYVLQFPELADNGEPPCDLIYEEYHVRRSAGETVQADEFYQRFPKSASGLRRLLPAAPLEATTAMGRKKQVSDLAPGQIIDDFELKAVLGKGAFATVFLAKQISLQRPVALKISADRGTETQTLARLEHTNIVHVHDQRRLPDRRLKLLYMQYASGGTLDEVIAKVAETPKVGRSGKLIGVAIHEAEVRAGAMHDDSSAAGRRYARATWPETVCRIGAQLAQALHYAHQKGILHRDVKPANVLLTSDGTPKLADFNISFCSQIEGVSPAAYFGGSLAYMSPEQLEACNPHHARQPEELDGRSDLYSLAVLLWELLFGNRPFVDTSADAGWTATLIEMVKRRQTEPPVIPRHLADDELTRTQAAVLLKAMSAERKDRYPDGAAFAHELLLCLQPRAQQLLTRPRAGMMKRLLTLPYWALLLTILLPNAVGGFFNQQFNYYNYVGQERAKVKVLQKQADAGELKKAELEELREMERDVTSLDRAFYIAMFVVNGFAFPFGIIVGSAICWPLCNTLVRINKGERPLPEELASSRKIALRFGEYVAWLGVSEWLICGLLFPPIIRTLSQVHVDSKVFGLFFGSLAVSGLISAAFPYFGATWLGVRLFYPALLDGKPIEPAESNLLALVNSRASSYLLVAVFVPFVGMFLMIFSGFTNPGFSLLFFVIGGICLYGASRTYQAIRSDIAALTIATRPLDTFGTGSESVEVN